MGKTSSFQQPRAAIRASTAMESLAGWPLDGYWTATRRLPGGYKTASTAASRIGAKGYVPGYPPWWVQETPGEEWQTG
jgi:hypothetical protein